MSELLRYVIVGGTGTLFDVIVFSSLVIVGVDKIIANTLGFLAGTALAFAGHHWWTFRNRTDKPRNNFMRFFVVNSSGLLLSNAIILVAVDILNWPVFAAKIAAIIIAGLTVYVINSRWSFR